MKEININIEGFNVNGICVGCLNYNRKMFYREEVKECFKFLGNIDVPDGLTIQVCWECLAYVKNMLKFQKQVLKSFDILYKYSLKNTFLNSPSDLSKHATQRLSSYTDVDLVAIHADDGSKVEVDVSVVKTEELDVKYERDNFDDELVKSEPEFEDTHYFEAAALGREEDPTLGQEDATLDQEQGATSDDDIQLSKLKLKKEKRDKKGKKKEKVRGKKRVKEKKKGKGNSDKELQLRSYRKLKNLPKDIVELFTMSEEEMWQVRADDVVNKDFVKLKYKCTECIIGFNTEKLMNDHRTGKHQPKSDDCHQCDVCKAYFLTKDNVSVHRSLHLTAYRCKVCGVRNALKRLMMQHVTEHRSGSEEGFKCTTCGNGFSTKSKLAYHRGVCHQERPQCDCCGKVFANKMTLKYHLKILPQNKDGKPKEKLYIPCKGCNKVFHSKKSYRAHVVIHDGLTYPCPVCGKLFQWKRNLARHARNHRERDAGATHECRDCGKLFSSRDCYNNHMRLSKRHVAEDAYVHECNYCGKKFATKWCMVDHIDWDHLKRIKYQCSVCFKAFKTAKIMVAHMNNIHEGKKNREPEGEHLCEICGKSYKTVKRLKGHVWAMHTNRSTTKSFKCKLCPATFTWQTSIYKHMKMMHDNKRAKQARPPPPPLVKKPELYPGIELNNRMQYFQQNLTNNLVQNMVHTVQPPPISGIVQNIV